LIFQIVKTPEPWPFLFIKTPTILKQRGETDPTPTSHSPKIRTRLGGKINNNKKKYITHTTHRLSLLIQKDNHCPEPKLFLLPQ
jgi:hypothetical protein